MNPEPDPVESIFAQTIEKPEAERKDFLNQACAGDAILKERVEALLKAHSVAGEREFLTGSYDNNPIAESPSERPGARIGSYKLLQQIGQGGMGVVFMAEQEQ